MQSVSQRHEGTEPRPRQRIQMRASNPIATVRAAISNGAATSACVIPRCRTRESACDQPQQPMKNSAQSGMFAAIAPTRAARATCRSAVARPSAAPTSEWAMLSISYRMRDDLAVRPAGRTNDRRVFRPAVQSLASSARNRPSRPSCSAELQGAGSRSAPLS